MYPPVKLTILFSSVRNTASCSFQIKPSSFLLPEECLTKKRMPLFTSWFPSFLLQICKQNSHTSHQIGFSRIEWNTIENNLFTFHTCIIGLSQECINVHFRSQNCCCFCDVVIFIIIITIINIIITSLFDCLFVCLFVFCSCFCINMYFIQCLPAIYLSPYVVLLHNAISYMYTVLCL
jgi:hypothetical protein